jgi:hypothetical protein
MPASALYERDILVWSEEQAAALRALARRPELSNALDWDNLIDEVESVGRSQLATARSLIANILLHVIKAYGDAGSPAMAGWAREVRAWSRELPDRFAPSMAQRIDLDALWLRAVRDGGRELIDYGRSLPPGLPPHCPFTLEELADGQLELAEMLARLHGPRPPVPAGARPQ